MALASTTLARLATAVVLLCALVAPLTAAATQEAVPGATALPAAVAAAVNETAAPLLLLPGATCSCSADCPNGSVCARPNPSKRYAQAPECILPEDADLVRGVFEYGCNPEGVQANEQRAAAVLRAGRAAAAEAVPYGGAVTVGSRIADGSADWAVRRRAAARRLMLLPPLGPAAAEPRS
ncbi:hypothetical protein Rsub_08473 [Raphidocelis subcapitata]|uniref:Uncharacterized protein n=1 Tax=Raphidocelis subcapitata TaxID=307507 RepID=A0A2V0PAA5_9CHLO|nr:hypothetical protein Rsub_08473 [Raphidocelis subcapitata]|eukprot:GBF95882.1 hypothetical protein Rsub_08473 [Raphidocelis subcapitata]